MKFFSIDHLVAIIGTAFCSFMIHWKYELRVTDIALFYLGWLALITAQIALTKVESK